MAGRERMSTWTERENNKRRERRRRAISTKIYSGLRLHGNYNLPKHCDNNEVLKALCHQAGWIVHHDGTTYRKNGSAKGCKPPSDNMDIIGPSVSVSPSSYDPSPSSSSFPSPAHYMATANSITDPNSLIPWLKNLSSNSGSASPKHPYFYIPGGSVSAPVTPPMSPPTNGQSGPNSPTFSFVSRNPFECRVGGGSRMWTPGQSGTCSPAVATGFDHMENVPMTDGIAAEFAFGDRSSMGVIKAWEGERIHEECIPDDLELKL